MSIMELGINVTVCGIIIVFSMLVLLVLLISLFGKVMSRGSSKPNKLNKEVLESTKSLVVAPITPVTVNGDEIIAVIAAAVAAMYEGSGKQPFVRSVKPSNSTRSPWATAGIVQNTTAF